MELLVASACLGIGISGVMSMIGAGRHEESAAFIRNQALIALNSRMEGNAFQNTNYNSILAGDHAPVSITLYTEAKTPILAEINSSAAELATTWANAGGTKLSVEYKLVYVKVGWSLSGKPDSVVSRKRVVDLK